jgi:hypothetical protein
MGKILQIRFKKAILLADHEKENRFSGQKHGQIRMRAVCVSGMTTIWNERLSARGAFPAWFGALV